MFLASDPLLYFITPEIDMEQLIRQERLKKKMSAIWQQALSLHL